MLNLQRASAGSGKTFTLAKKFIWYLITIKDPEKGFRLRKEPEILDGISRILAITFTNKATAEMKQRIIDKLASLAKSETLPLTPQLLKDTDYLEEFSNQLNVSHKEIARVSKFALSAILNQYSDFNVSTIDSFFQTVLRTFAYESNLNDTYQVEIDSDYIATAAIDATLDEVNTALNPESVSAFWLNLLMNDSSEKKGSVWNVFQKNTSDETIYSKLRNSLTKMENEEFKEKRGELDRYLATEKGPGRLVDAYKQIRTDIEIALTSAFDAMQQEANKFKLLLKQYGLDAKEHCKQHVDSHLTKIERFKYNDSTSKNWFKPVDLSNGKSILKKGMKCEAETLLTENAREMYAAYENWTSLFESEKLKIWKIYSSTLPYLGLLLEARNKITAFLDTNNLIQLGETNSMLNRIIGDSDTPFIYERLGTSLNHYLIDEFQDTSRMQWENLRKLLKESDSRNEENLIIGDAKQSIYRFRNADPSLITSIVPKEFAGRVKERGMEKEENTNWRSNRRIVEFNNYFFRTLAHRVSQFQSEMYQEAGIDPKDDMECIDFKNLYSNVVQYPNKQDDNGYVEIRFFDKPAIDKSENNEDEEKDKEQDRALDDLGPLISSLIERGYRQKDIAMLIDTKKLGKEVINTIVEYNSTLPPEATKIEFISEDSLLISSSEGVGIIINTLQKIADGTSSDRPQKHEAENETSEDRKIKWNDIKSDYAFFALQHPELSPAQQISEFIKTGKSVDVIKIMLDEMQAVTLPSLVEAIVKNFVSEDMRRSQAVYIAGFQDLVLDYCERYPADIASFLDWWKSRGSFLSISSPEDTDAVRVMTIHKSKGLEFKCVILPFEAKDIKPYHKKKEWRWVTPSPLYSDYDLPNWIPVETTKDMLGTEYADIYRKYCDMYMMDRLNSLYVAFTRAKCELYIFTKKTDENNKRTSKTTSAWLLRDICSNIEPHPEDGADLIPPELMQYEEDGSVITFGVKIDPKPEEEEAVPKQKDEDISLNEERVVEEYGVTYCPTILHTVENEPVSNELSAASDLLETELQDSATIAPEAADNDPRSDGNLLHAIMEKIKTADDLHRSILGLKMHGIITSQQAVEWEPMLENAIRHENVREWFDGKWRIMNERNIFVNPKNTTDGKDTKKTIRNRRPDRVMISADNKKAVIVDYKFGETPEDEHTDPLLKRYFRQIKDYGFWLEKATGIRDISSYIWYVRSNKIFQPS